MTKAQLKNMSVAEKTQRVKEDMAKGKFSSIEEACKAYKFAPASYYLHSKKSSSSKVKKEELPKTPTTAQNWIEDVEALRRENEELKRKVEQDRLKIFKLERKLVSFVIGEAQA